MEVQYIIKYAGSEWVISPGYFLICPSCGISSEHYMRIGNKRKVNRAEMLCPECFTTYFRRSY